MKIKNIDYPIKAGFRALRIYQEETGKSFDDLATVGFRDVVELTRAAMMSAAKRDGKEFVLTFDDIENAIDEDPKLLEEAMAVISEYGDAMGNFSDGAKKPTAT